jgi:dTDP-4-dehydrorhamnose reductase
MKYAVLGASGMLGADLLDHLILNGLDAIGFSRADLDLRDLELATTARKLEEFDLVINAAAFTDVPGAETNESLANQVNGYAAGIIAHSCDSIGNRLFHISTDYVFSGASSYPYRTDSKMDPINAYGRSKALGENLVIAAGASSTILRTSWLYGSRGKCFPKTIAAKLRKGEIVNVVNDQIGQPTWTRDLAQQILQYSEIENAPDILHVASSGQASWFDFAGAIATSNGMNPEQFVKPVSSAGFPSGVKRPSFSVLDLSASPLAPITDWESRWLAAESEIRSSLGD